jgi:hypothetical protein
MVMVDEPTGWRAFFCTDPSASVADILTSVADRFSLELTFRDCKGVVGAGRQQVRFVWANVGAFHVCLWAVTLTEAWAWGRPADDLVDRSAPPWDSPLRCPSHADKRWAWRRALLGEEIRAVLRPGVTEAEIQATAQRLLSLAAEHQWRLGKYREYDRGTEKRVIRETSPDRKQNGRGRSEPGGWPEVTISIPREGSA